MTTLRQTMALVGAAYRLGYESAMNDRLAASSTLTATLQEMHNTSDVRKLSAIAALSVIDQNQQGSKASWDQLPFEIRQEILKHFINIACDRFLGTIEAWIQTPDHSPNDDVSR